jgi:hypothetical protein
MTGRLSSPSSCQPPCIGISSPTPRCSAGSPARTSNPRSSSRRCWHDSCQQIEHLHERSEKSDRMADRCASYCLTWHRCISRACPPLLRQAPGQTQESPKSGVVVRRKPNFAEWYLSRITGNWTKSDLGKLSGGHRFACGAQPKAKCNEVHQSFATHVEPLHSSLSSSVSSVESIHPPVCR